LPFPPALTSPANGAALTDNTPRLTWNASPSPDVAGYRLDFDGAIQDVGSVTQYTTSLLTDGVYTWTVAAYDAAGNTSPYTDTWSFTMDTRSPAIVAVSPVSGAVKTAITAPAAITFSESISPSSFAYAVSPDPGGWSLSWDAGGSVATLLHNPFSYSRTYIFSVTASADLAGNPLAEAPYAWFFTTTPNQIYLPLVIKELVFP